MIEERCQNLFRYGIQYRGFAMENSLIGRFFAFDHSPISYQLRLELHFVSRMRGYEADHDPSDNGKYY